MVPLSYPVALDLDAPLEVARWRPLVHWILVIPHLFLLYVFNSVLNILVFIAWFAILFTGAIPRGMFDVMAMVHRYQWRVATYYLFMRESYPPFEFDARADDPATDPARYEIEYPERLSRLLIFVKWLAAIPHYIALLFVGIAAFFAVVVAWFAVLITGRWPEGLRRFVIGVTRWGARVNAYAYLMTDQYPPFALR